MTKIWNILVLCTGNSARSILGECLLNDLGKGRVRAFSAGSRPAGQVNPHALAILPQKNHDISGLHSKSWDAFTGSDAPDLDLVITVCGNAAGEVCPVFPGDFLRAHWGIADPAAAEEDDKPAAFRLAYRLMEMRVRAFLALPFETMTKEALRTTLQDIGAMEGAA